MKLFDTIAGLFKTADASAPAVLPGRNDVCWCGSGKKYKKCHMPEDEKKDAQKNCAGACGTS
jgi:hypothetical protein